MSAEKKKQYRSTAIKLCAGGLTLAVAGLVYFYSAPKFYRATAKAKIVKSGWNTTNDAKFSFGPERLPEECRLATSDDALDRVVTNLNLKAAWGKEINQGAPLKPESARDRLKAMLDVHPAPGAMMIEIQAKGTNPVELAQIVNEVTKLYADYRQSGREQASRAGLGTLRARWETQSQKVLDAQSVLNKLTDQFNQERETNVVAVNDPGAMEVLQLRRAQTEEEYKAKSNELASLKALNGLELREAVSEADTNANSVLAGALRQLAKANSDLRETQSSHGVDAPESKSARLAVEQLNHQVDGLVNSALIMRGVELSSLKVMLDQIKSMSEQMTRNADRSTNELAHFAEQDAVYAKAKEDLRALTEERDMLEAEMVESGSMSALMPDAIAVRVVELADPPGRPVSPDVKILTGALVGGGIIGGVGLALLVLLAMKPRGVEEKAG